MSVLRVTLLLTLVYCVSVHSQGEPPVRRSHSGSGSSGYNDPGYGQPGYNNEDNGPSGYGDQGYGSDYRGRPGLGGYRGGYYGYGGYGGYPAPSVGDQPLDEVDKLYSRLDNVLAQIKAYSEQYEAEAARLSLQKKAIDQLTAVTLTQLYTSELEQYRVLNRTGEDLEALDQELNSVEIPQVSVTSGPEQELVIGRADAVKEDNIRQDGRLANLKSQINAFKEKMLQVMMNMLDAADDRLELTFNYLDSLTTLETRKMCETGHVTLDSDDRKAEYQFQTTFSVVPQVTYGLCGFNFNLDSRKNGFGGGYGGYGGYGGGYGGYGGGYGYKEPEAMGVRANVYSTKTGLTAEMFDLGFGDTTVVTADVCFLACSMLPQRPPQGINFPSFQGDE